MTNRKRCILKYWLKPYQKVKDQHPCNLKGRGLVSINAVKKKTCPFRRIHSMFTHLQRWSVLSWTLIYIIVKFTCHGVFLSAFRAQWDCPRRPPSAPSASRISQASLKASLAAASQDSNSLSLLTEMSGVDAPVSRCSVSSLQSLASGLPKWRGELGNMWAWWRCSWLELLVEFSEGAREGSCCSLCGKKHEKHSVVIYTNSNCKLLILPPDTHTHTSSWPVSGVCSFWPVPVLRRCGPVSLAAVLEPVAHLGGCEPRRLGQVAFARRVGVWILKVPLPQQAASSFLGSKHTNI